MFTHDELRQLENGKAAMRPSQLREVAKIVGLTARPLFDVAERAVFGGAPTAADEPSSCVVCLVSPSLKSNATDTELSAAMDGFFRIATPNARAVVIRLINDFAEKQKGRQTSHAF